jgi:hypothetical protein
VDRPILGNAPKNSTKNEAAKGGTSKGSSELRSRKPRATRVFG